VASNHSKRVLKNINCRSALLVSLPSKVLKFLSCHRHHMAVRDSSPNPGLPLPRQTNMPAFNQLPHFPLHNPCHPKERQNSVPSFLCHWAMNEEEFNRFSINLTHGTPADNHNISLPMIISSKNLAQNNNPHKESYLGGGGGGGL
jgi:hypothetical protein